MHKRYMLSSLLVWMLVLSLVSTVTPFTARAQDGCGTAPPPRLTPDGRAMVLFTNGLPLNVRNGANLAGEIESIGNKAGWI